MTPTGKKNVRLEDIPMAAVDLCDHPFTLDRAGDLAPLQASLTEVGLLAPPWVRLRQDERYQVVAGLRRLQAMAALGWQTAAAVVLPRETSDSRCLLIAIADNAWGRGFSPAEQVFLARRLDEHFPAEAVVRRFLPLLGLPASPAWLERLLAAAALEAPWQTLLAQGRLALTAAARLQNWRPPDQAALFPVLARLPLSQSKQEEVLEALEILALRDGVSPGDILARPESQTILAHPTASPQSQAEAWRQQLRRWLQPRFTAAQQAFETGLQRLGLARHPRLELKPPEAFEGPDFSLKIKFRDQQELTQLLQQLQALVQTGEFVRLASL